MLIECLFIHAKGVCQVLEIKLEIKIDIIFPLVAQSVGNIN